MHPSSQTNGASRNNPNGNPSDDSKQNVKPSGNSRTNQEPPSTLYTWLDQKPPAKLKQMPPTFDPDHGIFPPYWPEKYIKSFMRHRFDYDNLTQAQQDYFPPGEEFMYADSKLPVHDEKGNYVLEDPDMHFSPQKKRYQNPYAKAQKNIQFRNPEDNFRPIGFTPPTPPRSNVHTAQQNQPDPNDHAGRLNNATEPSARPHNDTEPSPRPPVPQRARMLYNARLHADIQPLVQPYNINRKRKQQTDSVPVDTTNVSRDDAQAPSDTNGNPEVDSVALNSTNASSDNTETTTSSTNTNVTQCMALVPYVPQPVLPLLEMMESKSLPSMLKTPPTITDTMNLLKQPILPTPHANAIKDFYTGAIVPYKAVDEGKYMNLYACSY